MKSKVTTAIAAAFLFLAPMTSQAALTPYSQDFEGLVQAAPNALSADGWLIFANVFSPDMSSYYYGYGVFPAPNNTGGFCGVDFTPEPGYAAQDMVVYSDYNNGDHAAGNRIEANVFQERLVGAGDVGSLWTFRFDAKMGNLEAPTTALAFIKTLNPAAGYAMTNYITQNTTTTPATWTNYTLNILIDPSLVGQILQFGFSNNCSNYKGSGVFYDNISFFNNVATPTKSTSWGRVKSLYR